MPKSSPACGNCHPRRKSSGRAHGKLSPPIRSSGSKASASKPSARPSEISGAAAGRYKTIDLSNATVLPGLIDCHTHLTMTPSDSGPGRAALILSAPGADRRAQRSRHAGSRIHHGAQSRRRRIFGHRSPRRDQCWRRPRPAHARLRSAAEHHRRPRRPKLSRAAISIGHETESPTASKA